MLIESLFLVTHYLKKPAHKANALSVARTNSSDVEQIYGLKPVFIKLVNLSKHEIRDIQKKVCTMLIADEYIFSALHIMKHMTFFRSNSEAK